MAPLPTKRRKLSHDGSSESADESAHETGTLTDTKKNVPAQAKKVPRQRAHEDDSTIYAGGDYKSSLFKLQVDELLAEVQPDYEKRLRGVDEALRTLKGLMESITERDAVSVSIYQLGMYSTVLTPRRSQMLLNLCRNHTRYRYPSLIPNPTPMHPTSLHTQIHQISMLWAALC